MNNKPRIKLDAVSLVIDQNYTRAEASNNLGINPNMLGRWVKEADRDDGHAFRGNGRLTVLSQRLSKTQKALSSGVTILLKP
ncbi:transposase [Bathymodiolus platifrons methanotrophic gill symbiont]|uniref:transposase n=1 Tax=Bathymodiolus platifrons methanotrophic gill symbiont TaxID=113268 RepID=UPI001C8EAD57|nr:transposase [Bathymodiolus platifrons methanotrophic gill symbiont]